MACKLLIPGSIEALADAAYANRDCVAACEELGIEAHINPSANCTARVKGRSSGMRSRAWRRLISRALGGGEDAKVYLLTDAQRRANREEWKKGVRYGRRWVAEIVFSALKRIFGEYVMAKKWECIVQEVALKVATYNLMTAEGGDGTGASMRGPGAGRGAAGLRGRVYATDYPGRGPQSVEPVRHVANVRPTAPNVPLQAVRVPHGLPPARGPAAWQRRRQ